MKTYNTCIMTQLLFIQKTDTSTFCDITTVPQHTLSIRSGLLVAPTTVTFPRGSTPSSSVSNCAKTLSCTLLAPDPEAPLRSLPRASSSSKKTIAGATCLALRKTSRTALSDSPTHLLNSSGPCKFKYFNTIAENHSSNSCCQHLGSKEINKIYPYLKNQM